MRGKNLMLGSFFKFFRKLYTVSIARLTQAIRRLIFSNISKIKRSNSPKKKGSIWAAWKSSHPLIWQIPLQRYLSKNVLASHYPFLKVRRAENSHGVLSNYLVFGLAVYTAYSLLFDGIPFGGVAAKFGLVTFATPTATVVLPTQQSPHEIAVSIVQEMSISTSVPTATPVLVQVEVNYPTPVPVDATYTPLPTLTPYPTQRPVTGDLIAVGFSYYWPPWGPPNCHYANWYERENYCEDTTASGLPWSEYVGRGVAVPLEWLQNGMVSYGDTLRVLQPYEMVGDYIVLDACGDCIKEEGHIYVDFLDSRARLNWTVPMLVEIIRRQ